MKKILLPFVLLAIVTISTLQAQQQQIIALQSGEDVSFFSNLDSAIIAAPSGAEIYLPPGTFAHSSVLLIDKKINIYGVGHYLISTYSMMRTVITGNIYFVPGSDSSVIAGVYCDNIYLGNSATNDGLANILIQRCNIGTLALGNNVSEPISSSIFVMESVIRGAVNGYSAVNCIFSKCIFNSTVTAFSYLTVSNSIFLDYYYYSYYDQFCPIYSVSNSLIQSTIFNRNFGDGLRYITNSAFYNNLFVANITTAQWGENAYSNNLLSVSTGNIFVNHPSSTYSFSYNSDYHLKDTSPGKNAGYDGTDIGIYGTNQPYKENAVPFTPRIMQFMLTPEGNTINLNTSVEAQQR